MPSNTLSAKETVSLIAADKLTVAEVARDHLARYDQRQAEIRAWTYINRDYILDEAQRLDAIPKVNRGPLHGVVVGVKDIINVRGFPSQHYQRFFDSSTSSEDAACVAILRKAGALIFGKCATPDHIADGPCSNPHDPRRTPGGSSSGSAAAVCDFQAHISLGTQTVGSVTRPAAFCGTYSLKPTYGTISPEGAKPSAWTFDTIGMFARTASDLELVASVLGLAPARSEPRPLSCCKIGFLKTTEWEANRSLELEQTWELAKSSLSSQGSTVSEIELPQEFGGSFVARNARLVQAEGSLCFLAEKRSAPDRINAVVNGWMERQATADPKDYLAILDSYAVLRPRMDELLLDFDAVVTPSVRGQAPMGLTGTGDSRFNVIWTALHQPCVNIPGWFSGEGMPVGLSMVAPRFDDMRLLALAGQVGEVWAASAKVQS